MSAGHHLQKISTSWGDIVTQLRNGKVIICTLPHLDDEPIQPFTIQSRSKNAVAEFIYDTLRGRQTGLPPIGELEGSAFEKKVWNALMKIPAGETKSYGEIAEMLGNPRAYRAVANACGKNPVPLFVPCHRVIGSDGRLHGFSAGTAWKRMLLDIERK